jgi:phosphoglycolate phosphatase-like HAD superfamily hydrolase
MKQFCEYDTVIFDCDGVLFDSNFFKEEAFLTIASKYGDESISSMNKILSQFAGSSRYLLFEKFLELFSEFSPSVPNINDLLNEFSDICLKKYKTCKKTTSLNELSHISKADWVVISSSDQIELRGILSELDVARYFNGGIYGSPCSKSEVIDREILIDLKDKNVIYFGDGQVDIDVCDKYSFDMIFLTEWSSLRDYNGVMSAKNIESVDSLDAYTKLQKKMEEL